MNSDDATELNPTEMQINDFIYFISFTTGGELGRHIGVFTNQSTIYSRPCKTSHAAEYSRQDEYIDRECVIKGHGLCGNTKRCEWGRVFISTA
jgi:hypothetical protein